MTREQLRFRLEQVLGIYRTLSQSLWRAYELDKVIELRDTVGYDRPVLEIGCGDGQFSAFVFDRVEAAIDINPRSVEKAKASGIYDRVSCMDARDLQLPPDSFGTVFANCVVEHIPDLDKVLASAYRCLRPGGKLVITVPLREMNDHLLFRSGSYGEWRRKQLVHINLLTREQWEELLDQTGFTRHSFNPYLRAHQCRVWDTLDFPMTWGTGRYRVGTAIYFATRRSPRGPGAAFRRIAARRLSRAAARDGDETPCAAAFVAWK